MSSSYNKKVNLIGITTMTLVLICLFIPALYLWARYNLFPGWSAIGQIFAVMAGSCAVGWVVQPSSYYGALGAAGTYMGWSAGSVADIRMPAVAMAHEISGVKAGTPEGNVIAAMAVAVSVFVSIATLTVFMLIGNYVIAILPETVKASLSYVVVCVFGAVVANMIPANMVMNLTILAWEFVLTFFWKKLGLTAGLLPLVGLVTGLIIARVFYNASKKKQAEA